MNSIELPEHLLQALEVMSADTGVEPADLVRQAVFAWLRINGYVVPSALPAAAPAAPELEVPVEHRVDDQAVAALAQVVARLEAVDQDAQPPIRPRPPWPDQGPAEPQPPAEAEAAAPGGAEGASGELPRSEVLAPEQQVTGIGPRVPVVDEPEFEPGTQLLQGHPLAAYVEREGQERVRVVGDRFVIGRGPQCDLIIDSPRVSREHAALVREGMSYVLEDLGSSNGTFVGEERVTRQELQSGDVVRLGNEVMLVVIRAAEPSL